MRSKEKLGISVGISSIIMIFVILCLTTFGTLSYLTANSDYKITERAKEATVAYYKADCLAAQRAEELNKILKTAKESAGKFEQTRSFENLPCGVVLNTTRVEINEVFSKNYTANERLELMYISFCKMVVSLNKGFKILEEENKETIISYSILMDKTHSINVKTQVLPYVKTDTNKIIENIVVNTDVWEENDLNLWNGE